MLRPDGCCGSGGKWDQRWPYSWSQFKLCYKNLPPTWQVTHNLHWGYRYSEGQINPTCTHTPAYPIHNLWQSLFKIKIIQYTQDNLLLFGMNQTESSPLLPSIDILHAHCSSKVVKWKDHVMQWMAPNTIDTHTPSATAKLPQLPSLQYLYLFSSLVKSKPTYDEEECVSLCPACILLMFVCKITSHDVLLPCPYDDEFWSKKDISHNHHLSSKDWPLRIPRCWDVQMNSDLCACEYFWETTHYKTHNWEIFLVEELGRHVSFSHLTGNNVLLTRVFLVWLGIFIPRNKLGMPRSELGKNTCCMSAIPGHGWARLAGSFSWLSQTMLSWKIYQFSRHFQMVWGL